jgi:hypothetical protein
MTEVPDSIEDHKTQYELEMEQVRNLCHLGEENPTP